MPKATWGGILLAESDATVVIEGDHYSPPDSIIDGVLADSDTTTICPWKGTAHCTDVVVGGDVMADAAWYHPEPKDAASEIAGHVAFGGGVHIAT